MSATATATAALPSPHEDRSREEEDHSNKPTPAAVSTIWEGMIWSLEIVQQPVRARMCGFGDKDRRPITPPPCVLLKVLDEASRTEVDINSLDTNFFVVSVDLWDVEAKKEVNLVRHTQSSSPAISTVNPASFPHTISNPPPDQPVPRIYDYSNPSSYSQQQQPLLNGSSAYPNGNSVYSNGSSAYANGHSAYANGSSAGFPVQPPYPYHENHRPAVSSQYSNGYAQSHPSPSFSSQSSLAVSPSTNVTTGPTGMFTRNLIGSVTASAFKLTDTEDKLGIWFILQDLSVRTEGWFRLRVSFVKLQPDELEPGSVDSNGAVRPRTKPRTSPVLASVFSKPFQVFSAKKFPGVIESTELSRTFALQGIKIPIRKEPANAGSKRKKSGSDGEDNEEDE